MRTAGNPADLITAALRGDAPALARVGVSVRPPWWRRRVQARLAPRRYRLWVQRTALAQVRQATG